MKLKYTILLLFVSYSFYAQINNDLKDVNYYLNGLLKEHGGDIKIDDYLNVKVDLGSASAGRGKFNLKHVNILSEIKEAARGGTDYLDKRLFVTFKCKYTDCATDTYPSTILTSSVTLVFYDIDVGQRFVKTMKKLKKRK